MGFTINGQDKGEKTRQPKISLKEEIKQQILEQKQQIRQINKKVLISGENGTAKSSLSLALATNKMNDEEVVIYIDIDNSGEEIINTFYKDEYLNNKILLYKPDVVKETIEGVTVKDEEGVVRAVGQAAEAIKDIINEGILSVKAVIVDGVSFLLEFCEAVMRLDKNLDVDAGVQMNAWKVRNKAFRDFSSPFMALPTNVIFISHEDFIAEKQDRQLSSVKQRFIDECSMRITLEKEPSSVNDNVTDYVATVRKNRSDLTVENKKFIFMSVNHKEDTVQSDPEKLSAVVFPSPAKKQGKKGKK